MQAIGYIRVSTKEQRDGLSLGMQSQEIDRVAWNHQDALSAIFWDVQTGKRNDNRAGLQQALAAARSGQGTRLYVWRSDRLSRAGRRDLELLEDLRMSGVRVISCTEGDLTNDDPDSEFMGFIRAGLNQREVRMISMRTKRALQTKKENGEHVGRPRFGFNVVYGPEINSKGKLVGHLVPNPKKQDTIERIMKLRAGGESYRRIAAKLNISYSTVQHVVEFERKAQ